MTEVAAGSPAPGVFSRKASGLVSLYPGAQPWISTLLAALGMIFIAAAYGINISLAFQQIPIE